MARIMYGAPVKEEIKINLIKKLKQLSFKPVLVIAQVGDREDSNIYIKQKQKFGESIGVTVVHKKFDQNINEKDLVLEIKKINDDKKTNGVIVQLPLPKNIDTNKVLQSISRSRDADGLLSMYGENTDPDKEDVLVTPATARAVLKILEYYTIDSRGKKVVVIGKSKLSGKPIAKELQKMGAIVDSCDIDTKNTKELARNADILISATGVPLLISKEYINARQVVIDVGIKRIKSNETMKEKIVGDVDFDQIEPLVSSVTPVPGGVGPLTVACLFENLIDLSLEQEVV